MKILYRDNSVIVIEKSPDIPSEGERSALAYVSELTGKNCHLVHRLDTTTGGCMVFALDSISAGELSAQIENYTFAKEYKAVAKGEMEKVCDTFCDMLFFDRERNKSFVADKNRRGVKKAELSYKVEGAAEDKKAGALSLVRVLLKTGRTHQVRVQFASRKHPLLGDGKYGGGDNRCHAALWCTQIKFVSPDTKSEVTVRSECPDVFPWNLFED